MDSGQTWAQICSTTYEPSTTSKRQFPYPENKMSTVLLKNKDSNDETLTLLLGNDHSV